MSAAWAAIGIISLNKFNGLLSTGLNNHREYIHRSQHQAEKEAYIFHVFFSTNIFGSP
jgi:hypothetical protein